MIKLRGKYNEAIVYTDNLEEGARDQIIRLMDQEFVKDSKIRIMPDVHAGMGCVIGFTAEMGEKVIPNLVGVDIGCGVLVVKLKDIEIDFSKLDEIIRKRIPSGRSVHQQRNKRYPKLQELKVFRELKDSRRLERSLGTLGGGNHFIEVNSGKDGDKYLVIHSGSRNLGHQVASIYQRKAIKLREKDMKEIPSDLAYLSGQERLDYLHDMKICQEFAVDNREEMAEIILDSLLKTSLKNYEFFHTIHNYINFQDNIVRKGAISAYKDEEILIPINMRDGSILARGKGNPDWNNSAPHGAGRLMSRTQAREELSLENFKKSMENIYTSSVGKSTLDEAPAAYKDMEEILENLDETAEVIDILRPLYNFKA